MDRMKEKEGERKEEIKKPKCFGKVTPPCKGTNSKMLQVSSSFVHTRKSYREYRDVDIDLPPFMQRHR